MATAGVEMHQFLKLRPAHVLTVVVAQLEKPMDYTPELQRRHLELVAQHVHQLLAVHPSRSSLLGGGKDARRGGVDGAHVRADLLPNALKVGELQAADCSQTL
eukprot:CAMPEP_0114285154 /NCGR_PEP_ID=MMETSP0059-20121206/5030_1 /TAXON_ID=36894 /ORGANISM="Pyramimonas parkeae, Strain CCMP726" /LENGTH=102 /DNA_ID=CAMNT_0001406023 /DNA_START=362 /DNA_END=667 /DNA_ORIENTATION=-